MLLLSTPGGSPGLQPHPSGAVGDTLRPPVSAGEAFRRGAERLSAGDARGAADDFERALALGYRPAAEAHLRLGLARRHLPLHAFRAIRAFRAALREDPASLEARYGLADTYLALDGWEAQR
ncbi:MAG: tetratricopeptide repeat protein, partial [Gemmatimonadota bacterium]